MRFSGNNILLLPGVQQLNFIIDNIVVQTTGLSTIQFADSGNNAYTFNISGYRIARSSMYGASNLSTYNVNDAFSISGFSNLSTNSGSNYINYYVNDINIQDNLTGQNLPFYSLAIDVASGDTLDCDITMFSSNINYSLSFEPAYQGETNLTGYLTSDTNFWVFNSNVTFLSSFQTLLSGTQVASMVGPNNPLLIEYFDADDSTQEYAINFQLQLDTSIGTINADIVADRTGILDNSYSYIFMDLNSGGIVSGLFNGIWSGNQFVYQDSPQYATMNYFYSLRDGNGNVQSDNVSVQLLPLNPVNSGSYTASYITGFNLTNSGEYTIPPVATFTDYYYVTGLTQSLQTMLFSNGCTAGSIPVSFTSANGIGAGATGNLILAPIMLYNIYGVGVNQFFIPQNFILASGGTGYTVPPNAVFGGRGGCYDVPTVMGSQSIFMPFNSQGATAPLAAYLSGIVLTTTGAGGSGYVVTGLEVTNIGSGYNSVYVPQIQFVRQAGDTQTINASGNFSMKATGLYNFSGVWSIQTGFSNIGLAPMNGLSGTFNTNGGSYFAVQVGLSGLDNTQPVVAQLKITPSLTSGVTDLITGTKFFSTDPLDLKKNINVEETLIPPTADLSFLLTQTQLDQYYSSPAYLGNSFDVGDLDF